MASKKLEKQTQFWVEKGIINQKQAADILSNPFETSPQIPGNTFKLFAIIGSVLVGLGILIILAANWDSIGRFVKLGLSFFSLIAFYSAGYFLKFRKDMPKLGNALFFIGAVLFGGTIFLIGQIYNIQSNLSTGYLIWFLGIIPLVYLLRSKLIGILSVLVYIAFIIAISSSNYFGSEHTALFLLVAGVTWIAVASLHSKFVQTKFVQNPYQITGLAVWAVPSLVLTTRFAGDLYRYAKPSAVKLNILLALAVIIVTAIPIIDWIKKKISAETIIAPAFLITTVALIYFPKFFKKQNYDYYSYSHPKIPPAYIGINLIFFVCLLLIITVAHKQKQPLLAYSVSVLFGLGIIVRYFELASYYLSGQLGLLLLGAGTLLLILGGGLEAQRRRFKNA
ncbi:MAG: DUF2157 domain-containing protein [Actinobacteria bacterium]|nr:MAG: DUF2157 domain-containing protein [Actinomycetota bacterium]